MASANMHYYSKMINMTIGFWLLVVVFCIPGMIIGDYLPVLMIIGYSGLASLILLAIVAVSYRKMEMLLSLNNQKKALYDLVNLFEKDPKGFYRKYRRLKYSGRVYIALLVTASFASLFAFSLSAYLLGSSSIARGLGGLCMCFLVQNAMNYLTVKYSIPDIECLDQSGHPELFQHVENAYSKVGMNMNDRIAINEDLGISILNVHLGKKNKSEWILVFGLFPYLLLTEEEFESTIIHELMHKRITESEKDFLIHRKTAYWYGVLRNVEKGGWIARVYLKYFSNDYLITMNLFERALSKVVEGRVDQETIRYVDKDIYARALMKLSIISEFFSIEQDLMKFTSLPQNIYSVLLEEFHRWYNLNKSEAMEKILKQSTFEEDSHHRFKERMEQIGVEDFSFNIEFPDNIHSAEKESVISGMNKAWAAYNETIWLERKNDYLETVQMVEEFESQVDSQEGVEYAYALEKIGKQDEALLIYESILEKDPDNAMALCRAGVIYYSRNDENCIELFIKAVAVDWEFIGFCLHYIEDFLITNGMLARRNELAGWIEEMKEIALEKEYEENHIRLEDEFTRSPLSDEERNELIALFADISAVSKVLTAGKELRFSKEGQLIVGVRMRMGLAHLFKTKKAAGDWDRIHDALKKMNHNYSVYNLRENPILGSKFSSVEDAMIYERI